MDRQKSLKKAVALLLLFLSACDTSSQYKDGLEIDANKKASIELNSGYQKLLKCWDDNADKSSVDISGSITSKVYSDLGQAEITVQNPSNYYIVLIDLKSVTPEKTTVTAYGHGYMADSYIPRWMDTLRHCDAPKLGIR